MEPLIISTPWTITQKVLFRIAFWIIVLWVLPYPLITDIPFFNKLQDIAPWLTKAFNSVIDFYWKPWEILQKLFIKVFKIQYTVYTGSSGSGDKSWYFISFFLKIFLAPFVILIWSILDRKRGNYNTLFYWTRVLARYFLGYMMLYYGISKLFHAQMWSPSLNEMAVLLGDKSPMGLAWSFMGYSHAFSFYTGLGEVLGGLLLFWRRTTLLGSLILLPVMITVTIMNYTYDIPVKLNSTHYVLFILFLLIPDANRLMNLLVWNKTIEPVSFPVMIKRPWLKKAALGLKYYFILGHVAQSIYLNYEYSKIVSHGRTLPPLYGIYNTQYFIRNNDTIPMLLNDTTLWKQIIIDKPADMAHFRLMNDTIRIASFKVDTAASAATLYFGNDTLNKSLLHYRSDPPYLDLNGIYKGDTLMMRLKRYDEKNFLLVRQKFRWITEEPLLR